MKTPKELRELKAAAKAVYDRYVAVKVAPNTTFYAVDLAEHEWAIAVNAYFVAANEATAEVIAAFQAAKEEK